MKTEQRILEGTYRGEKPWKTLWHLYEPEKRRLLVASVFFVIKTSPLWLLPLAVAAIIDALSRPRAEALPAIAWATLGGFLALLQNIPTHVIYVRMLSLSARKVEAGLRVALCQRLQELSISFFRFKSPGALQSKILRDVENIDLMVRQLFEVGMGTVVMLSATILITAIRAPWFLPFYLLTVPAVVVMRQMAQKRLGQTNQQFRQEIEGMTSSVSGMIEMVPVARAHATEEVDLEKVRERIDRLRATGYQLDSQNAVFGSMAWVMFNGIYLLGLCLACAGTVLGIVPLTTGEIVMVSGFFNTIANSVLALTNALPMLQRGFESVRSVGELLECPDIEENRGKPAVGTVRGEFLFENIDYAYPNKHDAHALSGIHFHVPAGRTVAVIGPSGSGKSTLLGLILGFHRPSAGRVLLDGQDMNAIDLRSYRRQLAVVSQETILFPGTIRENIVHGIPHVSEARLEQALRDANALDFIREMPEGLETVVGQRGTTLSGGQRQRLAIARALIRDPHVLVLDEATSALDVGSESQVQEALERLMKGRTTFIVAHRLSTTRNADLMVVLEEGKIVEMGTPKELLARAGSHYAKAQAMAASLPM